MKKEKLIGLLVVGIFIMSAFQILAVSSKPTAEIEKQIETSAESEPAFTSRKSGVIPLSTFDVRIHGERSSMPVEDGFSTEVLMELAEQALLHQIDAKTSIERDLTIGAEEPFFVYESPGSIPEGRNVVPNVNFTLMGIGDHCYVWVHTSEIANATNGAPHVDLGTGIVNQTLVDNIVDTYDDVVFPNAYANFGMPNDVDNDPKIHIMVLDIAPDQEPSDDYGFTTGFHTWLNDDPEDINDYWDLFSNQAEMIFLDTYPSIYQAQYDSTGDGAVDAYYNMWDDADANLNGWTVDLMNQTDASGLVMPVVAGDYDKADLTSANTYYEFSVTTTGLAYWAMEDTTDYGSNTNDEEIAVSGYFGFTGSDMVLYFRVESTSHADGTFYYDELYTDLAQTVGTGDLPTLGGEYELLTGDHKYTIEVITGGLLAPVYSDETDYVANTLAHELVLSGDAIDEAGVYTINVTTGGDYAAIVTDPVFDGTHTGTEIPAIAGNYIYAEDMEYYAKVTSGGNLRYVLPDTASGGALSTYWNGSDLIPIDGESLPAVAGIFIGDEDTDFVAEVVTGGLLGIESGVSLKFSDDAGATWSDTKVIEPNYPIRVLDSDSAWLGFTLDFSQYFYNLTVGDQFTVDVIATDEPELAFSNDGVNYGDSVVIPENGLIALNGTATGLLLDFSVVTEELTVDDVWYVDTIAYNAPYLEFTKDGGAIYANVTLTDAGFELPYNSTFGTGIMVDLDNFAGIVEANDTYIIEIEATETVSIDFGVDGGAVSGTPVDWVIGDDPLNISTSGFNIDFTGLDALTTGDIYELTVINGTENSATITFSNDDATYDNATVVTLDNLEIAISDQVDTVYGDLMVDFSDLTKLVTGDNYQVTLTGEENPVIHVDGTDYQINTSNPMVPLGDSGIYLDFSGLNISDMGLVWNATINDVTLNDLPELINWDEDLVDDSLIYTNWHLIDNGNDWEEEFFIRAGMPLWAIYLVHGLSDEAELLQVSIQEYLKYPDGQRFTVEGDHPWYTDCEAGQSFLFLLYLYDHYGGVDFMHALSTGMTHGWDAIASALGAAGYRDLDVEQIYMDFNLAVYVDDSTIPNSDDYGGAGNQYGFASIDLMAFPWMEGYAIDIGNASSYEVLDPAVLTDVSMPWYLSYWYGKYGGGVPIGGFVADASAGPVAGGPDGALARYLGGAPKSYELAIYEFQNVNGSDSLDIFFDGLDEQLFLDYDGTGPGDMWWSGDQKGANPAGTAVATEPDNKYVIHEVPAGTVYIDWYTWFQTEHQWDYLSLEVSTDSADGIDGTWYTLPWIADGAIQNSNYHDWLGISDWTGTVAYPSPAHPLWGGDPYIMYGDAAHNSYAEAWSNFWSELPAGATYIRFCYMTDWGTQLKGMWLDHVLFQDGAVNDLAEYTFTGQADEGWFTAGNKLVDGTVISGWIHPPASATPNNFLVAAIYTDMDAGYVEGSHSVYYMNTADSTEIAIIQRLTEERIADREQITMIVIPTTEADAPSDFTGGLYNASSINTGEVLEFSLAPAEGLIEGSVMFQWPIADVKPETVHSLIITEVSSGEKQIFYAPGTNTFVWRAGTWTDGDYTVQLRATYLDFNNPGVFTDYYIGQSSVAYSAVLEYTLENVGPVIDTASGELTILANGTWEDPVAEYKYSIDITDASDIYSAWIYFSDNDGDTYTLALLKQGAGDTWSVEFDAASKNVTSWTMMIDVHAQDTFGLKTIETGLTGDGAVHEPKPPKKPTPGFEMIFALFALAGLSVILTRRRE